MTAVEHYINTFVPENYNLFLDIDRDTKTFHGNLALTGEALEHHISLHQKGLTISSAILDNQPLDLIQDDEKQAVHLHLPETGQMTLFLEFSGRITDNMTGIYPSYYTVDGQKKEVIATQFESHFAREAFPCIDEPEAKATFDLSIKFDQKTEEELVLSNMPEINSQRRQETGIWQFATSPRMSSYLLAFAIGDLQSKHTRTKNGVDVAIFATKAHQADKLDFALAMAKQVIEFYEAYFGVAYPLPQSYHLALPDFSAGAMENWGLVTYREVYLLADQNSTIKSRQTIALVIAHEIAHQWFGNLVTMTWWDDLWLNESFANMMENLSLDHLYPDWKVWEDFQASGVPAALKRDATDGVQSVHVGVTHPDEINTLFDAAIVYAKGSRLMVMLHRWLGDEAFRNGLRTYFNKHQYQNTVGKDLWEALSQASHKDVAGFMAPWLEQPGYPLVTARLDGDELVISQGQFFIGEHEDKGRLWQIPLNSNWSGLPDTLDVAEIRLPNYSQLAIQNEGALRFNTQNTAHYLVNYEGDLWEALLTSFPDFDPITKRQLVQERQFLAASGQLAYADLLPLVPLLAEEESYLVGTILMDLFTDLKDFVDSSSPAEATLKTLIRQTLAFNYHRLGWDSQPDDRDEDRVNRQTILQAMVINDHQPALEQASAIFQAYRHQLEAIPAYQRRAVLIGQIRLEPSVDLARTYLEAYVATTDARFKLDLAAALSYQESEEVLELVLSQFKDKEVIKPQDLETWYAFFLAQEFSQSRVWNWACTNWEWIKGILGGDMAFEDFVSTPARIFKTSDKLDDYKAFFEPQLEDLAISRSISMGIKAIAARVERIRQNKEALHKALTASVVEK